MKRFLLTACAGLLAAAVASPSLAADLPKPAYKAPLYYAAPFSWTGFYVGLNGGYAWGTASFSDPILGTFSLKGTGWLGGGTVGYNLQTGSWVWGLEADMDYISMKANDSTICAAPGCESRTTWFGTGRGRIGYAFDRYMIFATGGAAYGNLKFTNPAGLSETKTRLGWTIGGGVEYAVLGPWSVKAEYLYADLGKFGCSATVCGPDSTIKLPINMVRLGVNYRF